MAAKKTAATPKTQPAKLSAPTAGEHAEVLVTGAGQPAPQTVTESATPATPTAATSATSPEGESTARNDGAALTGEPVVTHLLVSSLVQGFRRGGRTWSTEQVKVSVGEFSHEQLRQIVSEPLLNVMPVAE